MIVGIDRFMSEARALTNFTGNAVATVLIGTWVKEIDGDQVDRVLSGAAALRRADHDRRTTATARWKPEPQPVPAQRLDARGIQYSNETARAGPCCAGGFLLPRPNLDLYLEGQGSSKDKVKFRGIPCRAL